MFRPPPGCTVHTVLDRYICLYMCLCVCLFVCLSVSLPACSSVSFKFCETFSTNFELPIDAHQSETCTRSQRSIIIIITRVICTLYVTSYVQFDCVLSNSPAYATLKLLDKKKLTLNNIDVFEYHEAFAVSTHTDLSHVSHTHTFTTYLFKSSS